MGLETSSSPAPLASLPSAPADEPEAVAEAATTSEAVAEEGGGAGAGGRWEVEAAWVAEAGRGAEAE
jgi:hypothetical protein